MAGYIDDLVVTVTEPAVSDDPGDFPAQYADDKKKIQDSFPNVSGPVGCTEAELNILDGATVTTAELNILDGVTSTAAELNILDGVTSTAAELNILDGVTSTAAELNILDGVTATAAEINLLAGASSVGAVREIKVENAASGLSLNTSWQDRDTVTLSDVQSGSYVFLLAVTQFNATGVTGTGRLAITDNSNTILCNSGAEQGQTYVASQAHTCVTMALHTTPGTGAVTYKVRGKANDASGVTMNNTTIIAVEFAP